MNPRKGLAAALEAQLDRRKFKIIPEPEGTGELEAGKHLVILIRTTTSPASTMGQYLCEFGIWVIDPKQIAPEDSLDDAFDAVILALDEYEFVTWERAERSTYRETYPAWRISATTLTKKE